MRFAAALLMLCTGAVTAAQDGKKYDLKLTWIPVVGYRSTLSEDVTEEMKMSVALGERVLKREQKKDIRRFRAVEEILEVKGKEAVRKTWTFQKAARKVGGEDVPFGFEGKKVVITQGEDGKLIYRYDDGSTPATGDLEALRGVFSKDRQKKKEDPDPSDLFAPPDPVAALASLPASSSAMTVDAIPDLLARCSGV